MTNRIKAKLNSRKGASIIFALMFLLLASAVTVSIIDAAVTTAKRVNDDKVHTQDYLVLKSAAELFEVELRRSPVTVVKTSTELFINDVSQGESAPEITYECTGPLCNAILPVFKNAYEGHYTSNGEKLTVHASGGEMGSIFKDVIIEFKLLPEAADGGEGGTNSANSYKILAKFYLADKSQYLYMTAALGVQSDFDYTVTTGDKSSFNGVDIVHTNTIVRRKPINWSDYNFSSSAATILTE